LLGRKGPRILERVNRTAAKATATTARIKIGK